MYNYKIIQNWSKDLFHSSVIQFDKKAYLFNCCDGTQRNALEQGLKFHKISNIFYNTSHIDAYLGTYGFTMSRYEQISGQLIAHKQKQTVATELLKSDGKKTPKKTESNLKEEKPPEKNPFIWGPYFMRQNFQNCGNFFIDWIVEYVNEYYSDAKCFISNKKEKITHFEDENIKIYPILIDTLDLNESKEDKIMMDIDDDLSLQSETSNLNNYKNNLLALKKDLAMSYICEPHPKKPTFLVKKAKDLGIPPGQMYGQLQSGKSVIFNGKEIKPEDVLDDPQPASCIGIFYSPTLKHAIKLTKNDFIENFRKSNQNKIISLCVHIIGESDILNNEIYQSFIESFGKDIKHIIDCKATNTKYMLNEGSQKIRYLLNQIDSSLFKINQNSYEDVLPEQNIKNLLKNYKFSGNIIDSRPGMEYGLVPLEKRRFNNLEVYQPFIFKNENFVKYMERIDKIVNELKAYKEQKLKTKDKENINIIVPKFFNEPTLTFLGTSSMKPGVFRNVSSIMVQFETENSKKCNILMDCGEGTYSQILSHVGHNNIDKAIANIRIIFITHKHGDHMLGTLKVLSELDKIKLQHKVDPESQDINLIVYVIAPTTVYNWIQASIEMDLIYSKQIILIDNSEINPNINQVYHEQVIKEDAMLDFNDIELFDDYTKQLQKKLSEYRESVKTNEKVVQFNQYTRKLFNIEIFAAEVFHCIESYGCIIQTVDYELDFLKEGYGGWKISYSGDTRPCNNFQNFSANSTVFIHEATFDDELQKDAHEKMHSTFNEGITIGKKNNAWRIALTHFSPRYAKAIPWRRDFKTEKILLAHDYLSLKLSRFYDAFNYTKDFSKIMEIVDKEDILKQVFE